MNLFKKLSAIILTVFLVVCITGTVAYAADESSNPANKPSIAINDASGAVGDTVTINVSVNNNPGLGGIVINIVYDEAYLEFVSNEIGPVLNVWDQKTINSVQNKGYGEVRIAALSLKNHSDNGILASLSFKIKPGALIENPIVISTNGKQALQLVQYDTNNSPATIYSEFSVVSGKISVENGAALPENYSLINIIQQADIKNLTSGADPTISGGQNATASAVNPGGTVASGQVAANGNRTAAIVITLIVIIVLIALILVLLAINKKKKEKADNNYDNI